MSAWRVVWRPLAIDDLRAVVRFIGQDNPARAHTFGDELRQQMHALEQFPERGRAGRIKGTRELVLHLNYIGFYRVDVERHAVEILRIKHARRR